MILRECGGVKSRMFKAGACRDFLGLVWDGPLALERQEQKNNRQRQKQSPSGRTNKKEQVGAKAGGSGCVHPTHRDEAAMDGTPGTHEL